MLRSVGVLNLKRSCSMRCTAKRPGSGSMVAPAESKRDGSAAAVEEIERLLQRRERAVVHVGGGQCDVAERRRLELEAIVLDAMHREASGIGIDGRAGRVETRRQRRRG